MDVRTTKPIENTNPSIVENLVLFRILISGCYPKTSKKSIVSISLFLRLLIEFICFINNIQNH